MATFRSTKTSTLNLQPRIGGDLALIRGIAKVVLEQSKTDPKALDIEFIERFTAGFEQYRSVVEATPWDEIERKCGGVTERDIRSAAKIYRDADRSIISWCLGVTQHEHGVDTVREIVNLLLLRGGNLGREGAGGPSPVRGHSNVQGNRTCGIDHRPTEDFLGRLAEVCKIDPPPRTRPGHRQDHRGHAQRRAEGVRGYGRQLRRRRTRHRIHLCRAPEMRTHRAGQYQTEPQPHRPRPPRPDPALPRPDREGPPALRRAVLLGGGFDEYGAPVARNEDARIPRS